MGRAADTAHAPADRPPRLAAPGALERLRGWAITWAAADSYAALVIAAALVIGPWMLPAMWSANEIVYFDLAYHSVHPEAFTNAHAMFDASHDRFASMWAIGSAISLLGFEGAKTVLALLTWALYALGLAAVARGIGLRVAPFVAAVLCFFLARQYLVGAEWIFGTVEPKTLAYPFVFFGFALALSQRWVAMVLVMAIATYFHFLIGGAWVLLFLLLLAMERRSWTVVARLLALYTVLVLPQVAVIVHERIGPVVDTSALPGTIDQIYAVFRVPHHVAPFAKGMTAFGTKWLPGLVMHAALCAALVFSAASAEGRTRTLAHWAALLNLWPLLATAAAFIDRDTHVLAKFLVFRPSALILLVSCLMLARLHFPSPRQDRSALAATALCLSVGILAPGYLEAAAKMVVYPPGVRLLSQLSEDQRDIVRWITETTPKDSAILARPELTLKADDDKGFPLGLERLTGRAFIVTFKNVPSDRADFVRWYTRLEAADRFFSGDCSQLALLKADYVIAASEAELAPVAACTTPVYRNAGYIVAQTRAAAP